MSEPFSMHNIV